MENPLRYQHFEVLTRPDGTPHVLGKGAMGVTYKAFDRNLHSIVVIKVINPRYVSDPLTRRRFLKEAQAMARIRHPNVANVFHFGETEQDVFYAMEFCDGPNLDEFVRQGRPMAPVDALLLMKQAASALQAIEKSGLVHRDVKPSNIILTDDVQGATQLKLIDFGLARGERGDSDIDPGMTRGGFVGTPGYASPEQLLEQEDLDIRSDIYSLGGTFWFALAGGPVFRGSHVEVMFNHVNSPPPWDQLPPLPQGVREVLEKMLGKSRDDRYQSPGALWEAIDECLRRGNLAEPGALPRLQLQAGRKAAEASIVGRSNYEILADAGEVKEGKLFRARDIVSGSTVALRYLRKDLLEKPGLLPALRAAVMRLQAVDHPNHVRIHDFLEGDDGMQLVTEWVEGPSLLQLLKSRERPVLRDLLPLLVQLSAAFDHAIRNHIGTCETEPHQITIRPEEGSIAPGESSRFLRASTGKWGDFHLKMNPLGLSFSPVDYAEKIPAEVDPALFQEFLRLLHLLMGGVSGTQTHGYSHYATLPALGAAGNEVLEKHFSAGIPENLRVPCRTVLAELAAAEGVTVEWPPEPEVRAVEQGRPEEPADIEQTMVSVAAGPSVSPDSRIPGGSVGPAGSMGPGMGGSVSGSKGWSISQAGGSVFQRRQELERQRRMLEARAPQLAHHEVLEAERNMLAQERSLLEQQREELLVRERERAQAAEQEKRRLEEERRRLESRGSELESKRAEQERLAQELQLRSQLEFQKLQDEKQRLEQEWESRRLKTEALLRDKEEQFLLNEQRSLRRIQEERERLEATAREVEQRGGELSRQANADLAGEEQELRREREALLARQRQLETELQERDHALLQAREELRAAVDSFEARRVAFEEERAHLAAEAERERREAVAAIDAERQDLLDARAKLEKQRLDEAVALENQLAAASSRLAAAESALTEKQREFEAEKASLAESTDTEAKLRMAAREQEMAGELEAETRRIAEERARYQEERVALEARGAAEREKLAAAEKAMRERAADLENQLAEVQAAMRAKEEALAARQSELDTEWRKLEASKEEARQALGMELDSGRQAVAREREELARRAAQLESEAATRQAERERLAAAAQLEIERQRAEIAAQKSALAAEQDALRAGFEAEKHALLEQEEARRRAEEDEHRQKLAARAKELSILEESKGTHLERLQQEIAEAERMLSLQREELFKQERVNEAVLRKASRQDDAQLLQIQAEQARMDQQRVELDAKLAELKRAQKKRLIAIGCGIIVAIIAAYYLTNLIQLLINPTLGEKQAWDALATERQQFRAQSAWPDLLRASVKTIDRFTNEEEFRNKETGKIDSAAKQRYADYYNSKRPELEADARAALEGLAANWRDEMRADKEATADLLRSLDRVQGWGLSSQAILLRALIGMPEQRDKGDFAAALAAYLSAIQADAAHATPLAPELRATLDGALAAFRSTRKLSRADDILAALDKTPAEERAKIPAAGALTTELHAESLRAAGKAADAATTLLAKPDALAEFAPSLQLVVTDAAAGGVATSVPVLREVSRAMRANPDSTAILKPQILALTLAVMENPPAKPQQSLQILLNDVPSSASWAEDFKPHLAKTFNAVRALPPSDLGDPATRSLLVQAGDTWKIAAPYLILAATEPAAQQRFDFYRKADEFGSIEAKAHVGRFYYGYGVENSSKEHVVKGMQMMEEAAKGGDATAFYLLGEIQFAGIGVQPNPEEAVALARKARAAGHPKAVLLEGQALLRKAEMDVNPVIYTEASTALNAAIKAGYDEAWYFLYVSYWNNVANDADKAAAALRGGAAANNANCLFALATWEDKGNPPVEQNLSSAREHYAQAARAGHPGGRKWCVEYAVKLGASASPADKAWVEKNKDVCQPAQP